MTHRRVKSNRGGLVHQYEKLLMLNSTGLLHSPARSYRCPCEMMRPRKFQGGRVEETPLDVLFDACSKGSVDIVESLLVSKKVDVSNLGWLSKSPLYEAVCHYISDDESPQYRRIVELLLQHGADPYKPDFDRWTVAMKIFRDRSGLAELLINYTTDPNRRLTNCGSTALHLAVQGCSVDIVRKLLEKRADVNTSIHRCAPVFHVAVMCDRHDLINLLVQHGADPKQLSAKGLSVLHRVGSGKMVRKLMTYGLDINARVPPNGDTPLRSSISSYCNDDVIKALLDCGADYKINNDCGFTAFDFIAAKLISGNDLKEILRMGKILLDHVISNVPEDVNDPETQKIRKFGEELRLLKSERIGNTSITFWKLINTSSRKAGSFSYNGENFMNPDITKFPLFGQLIQSRMCEGLEYYDLENYARGFIKEITLNRLPWDCIDKIISYLDTYDLKYLKRRLSLEKRQNLV